MKNSHVFIYVLLFCSILGCSREVDVLKIEQTNAESEFVSTKGSSNEPSCNLNVLVTYNFPRGATEEEKEIMKMDYINEMRTFFTVCSITQPNDRCSQNMEKWVVDETEFTLYFDNNNHRTLGELNPEGEDVPGDIDDENPGDINVHWQNDLLENCFTENAPALFIR